MKSDSDKKYYGLIYKVTNLENRKIYIGQTTKTLEQRKNEHIYISKRENDPNFMYISKALAKYGEIKFTWIILGYCNNKKDLNSAEQVCIDFFKSYNHRYGYNLTLGGEGQIPNDITREKLRKSQLGKKHSEEARKNQSMARRALFDSEKGMLVKERISQRVKEHILRTGYSSKGRKQSEETKEKLRRAATGRKMSEKNKEKLRLRMLGNTCGRGIKQSQESIEKRRLASTGKKRSEEFRKNLSARQKNKTVSKETREKISKKLIGKTWSEERNHKVSISLLKYYAAKKKEEK